MKLHDIFRKTKEPKELNEFIVLLYRFGFMMVLFTLCRIAFYLFNTSLFPNVTALGFLNIMRGGFRFDIAGLLYLNVLFILLSLIPHPWKFSRYYQGFLKGLFFVINGIGIATNSIDIIYYRFILKRTTASVFAILKNEENLFNLGIQFIFDFWYVLIFFLVMMWMMVKLYALIKPVKLKLKTRKWVYYPISLVLILFAASLSIIGIRGGYSHSTRPITLSNAGKYVESVEEMAIVLNTPFCIIRTFNNKSFKHMDFFESEEAIAAIYTPEKYNNTTNTSSKKNVVIFILESFNREFLGSLNKDLDNGSYRGYTPFLDSLINHSLVFPNAYANGRKSIDAMPSIVSSIPSLVLPYVISEYSSNKVNSLASILRSEGYQTSFFHGAPNGSMGFQAYAKLAGFHSYVGKDEYANDDDFDGIWGIWDEPFFMFWAQEMTKMQEPFYTTLFSISSHHPFKVPEKYDGVFPKGTLPVHQCVGYTDHAIKQFFEYASNQDWYDNTLFIITADHSTVAHYPEYQNSKNVFAIPLVFYTPDGSLNGVNHTVAQQLDIMPTVLSHIGYNKPFVAFGNNLLNNEEEKFTINFTNGYYQYINDTALVHFDGKRFPSFYDLKKDPYLKHNMVDSISFEALKTKVKAVVQQYNNRMIEDRLTITNPQQPRFEKELE